MGQSKVKKTFRERITPLLDCFLSHFTFICLKVIKARFNSVKPDERLKALKNKFGRDLDADYFQPNEIVAYSQRLINSPLSGALDYLALGTVSSEEGDDDE